jgi:cellulose synthase/poly-beta-1,6-N-acetylglucosamine synthase-like glycosyltransferase
MYVIIVAAWMLLCVPMVRASIPIVQAGFHRSPVIGSITIATILFIAYFWLNGMKDLIYPIAYRVTPWRSQSPPPRTDRSRPLVGLLYVTCNDFEPEALSASSIQDYANYEVVILDDSSKPEYIRQVNRYAALHHIRVIRRDNKPYGFKGGNLNWYLQRDGQHLDYFVIVDSDEILPPYFITRALDYFANDPTVGIVQANHVATRNRTTFMRTFAAGVDAHWPAYQQVKAHAGFLSLLGHGAMISQEAYQAGGGFPNIVAEDIGFAIDALVGGFRTEFAADIRCEEEFPVDYFAFKKRHRKWTEGNMEFIRTYTRRILFSRKLRWYEKLDIILFTYSLPLTGVFSLYVVTNAILFPFIKFSYEFPLWMLIPTVACLVAPTINDILTWRRAPKGKLLSYLLHSVALFGSMFFVSLFASVRTMFKGSIFTVTPKTADQVGLRAAFSHNVPELIAAAVLAVVVELASGSILPVILLIVPTMFTVYLSVMNAPDESSLDEFKGTHMLQEKE